MVVTPSEVETSAARAVPWRSTLRRPRRYREARVTTSGPLTDGRGCDPTPRQKRRGEDPPAPGTSRTAEPRRADPALLRGGTAPRTPAGPRPRALRPCRR